MIVLRKYYYNSYLVRCHFVISNVNSLPNIISSAMLPHLMYVRLYGFVNPTRGCGNYAVKL